MKYGEGTFYVTLYFKDGKVVGHRYDPNIPAQETVKASNEENDEPQNEPDVESKDFERVVRQFVMTMETYRRFMSIFVITASNAFFRASVDHIQSFIEKSGTKRDDFSKDDEVVYELNDTHLVEFLRRTEELSSVVHGVNHLPELLIIGLVSSYDSFLTNLLKVVINRHEEIVLTSEKNIRFSELSEYESIDRARQDIISREIEGVIRQSHHDQFNWMEKKPECKIARWPWNLV